MTLCALTDQWGTLYANTASFQRIKPRLGIQIFARELHKKMADAEEAEPGTEELENEASNLDNESTNISMEEEVTAVNDGDEKQGSMRLAQLPHTRVRNMMKLDSDLHIASQDSVFLVTKAAVSILSMLFK